MDVYSDVYVLLLTRVFSMKISDLWMCTLMYTVLFCAAVLTRGFSMKISEVWMCTLMYMCYF